jgi:predicted small metal-binding protein
MECPLEGHHLEADNDEELFKATRKHADEVHPEQGFTDEQLRSIIEENVYEKWREPALRAGAQHPGPCSYPYSPKCVEGTFSEVRHR